MFDNERLIAFVDGFVTNEPDLTDEMYENEYHGGGEFLWFNLDKCAIPQKYKKYIDASACL